MRNGIYFGTTLIAALMLVAVACGGGGTTSPAATPTKSATQGTSAPTKPAGTTPPTGEIVKIQQQEAPLLYRFVPDTYNFTLGKTYTLQFEKTKEFHTFSIEGLTIKEGQGVDIFVNIGETVQQTITPTKAGAFKLFCVPHEGLGMVGKVVVQ